MTFKHVKFQDSPVMRSLEKVAREKGMIKQPSLEKTASKTSFASTGNLLADLLKLSEGLRSAGLVKQADDLEMKALAYKKAQTLYETSKEKGEDLVDAAHPDGGHKLEDLKNDEAVFETIVEQHLKNVDMVGKNPTGKLANSKDILGAVKKVLGQDANVALPQNLSSGLLNFTKPLSEMFNSMQFFSWERETIISFNRLNDFVNKTVSSKAISMGSANRIVALANDLKTNLTKETVLGMQSTASKNASFYVTSLVNFVEDTLKEEIKSLAASAPKPDANVSKFSTQVDSYLNTLKNWAAAVNNDPDNTTDDKKKANEWITARTNELNDLKAKFRPEESEGFVIALQKSRFVREASDFKKAWIG